MKASFFWIISIIISGILPLTSYSNEMTKHEVIRAFEEAATPGLNSHDYDLYARPWSCLNPLLPFSNSENAFNFTVNEQSGSHSSRLKLINSGRNKIRYFKLNKVDELESNLWSNMGSEFLSYLRVSSDGLLIIENTISRPETVSEEGITSIVNQDRLVDSYFICSKFVKQNKKSEKLWDFYEFIF